MFEEEIIFRPISKNEKEEVASMIKDFYKGFDAPDGYMTDKKIDNTFYNIFRQNEHLKLTVFYSKTTMVGYALLFNFWSNENGGMVLNIDELYIKPEFRGKGISSFYLSELAKQNEQYVALTLEVLPQNKKAYELYKRHGFTEKETLFLYKLL